MADGVLMLVQSASVSSHFVFSYFVWLAVRLNSPECTPARRHGGWHLCN